MWLSEQLLRKVNAAASKDEVLFISKEDHSKTISEECSWMNSLRVFKRQNGPRFADGSINWQCPCMAGGSLVAHRCGHFFRQLYICMTEDVSQDASVRCPEQFIDWAACMQNMSDERRMQMRTHLLESEKEEAS